MSNSFNAIAAVKAAIRHIFESISPDDASLIKLDDQMFGLTRTDLIDLIKRNGYEPDLLGSAIEQAIQEGMLDATTLTIKNQPTEVIIYTESDTDFGYSVPHVPILWTESDHRDGPPSVEDKLAKKEHDFELAVQLELQTTDLFHHLAHLLNKHGESIITRVNLSDLIDRERTKLSSANANIVMHRLLKCEVIREVETGYRITSKSPLDDEIGPTARAAKLALRDIRTSSQHDLDSVKGAATSEEHEASFKDSEIREAGMGPGKPTIHPKKKSTASGDARARIVAALTKHHKYNDGGVMNQEPITVTELAKLADVAKSSVSKFFKDEFNNKTYGGHKVYQIICQNNTKLIASLKMLNGEYSPHHIIQPDKILDE